MILAVILWIIWDLTKSLAKGVAALLLILAVLNLLGSTVFKREPEPKVPLEEIFNRYERSDTY